MNPKMGFRPVYSGERSRDFWARINEDATSNHEAWKKRYDLAVRLQNLEMEVLRKINPNLNTMER